MQGKKLTEGKIGPLLWSLAWPMMLSVFFNTLYNTIDAFWVSKISPQAIAAVSISQITLFILVSLSMGITVGSGVLMSMYIGAGEMKNAQKILGQSFVLSAIMGVISTVLALIFKYPLLRASGATGAILAPAVEYFDVVAMGAILLFIMFTIVFAFNAQGDTKTVTKFFAVSTAVNTVLDPILIFGWWGAPALGIAGAAIATLISQAVFIVMGLYVLTRPKMMVPFHFANLSFHWELVKRVINIGFPASLTNALGPIGIAITTLLAATYFGEAGAIAVSIGFRVEFFAFLPAIGYGFGSMAMLGQNIGAKQIERAREGYHKALSTGATIAAVFGLVIALLAVVIVGLFTKDPLVSQYARWYLWTVPLSYGFLAAMIIESTSFQGIGKSWQGFWITLFRIAIVTGGTFIMLQITSSIFAIWTSVILGYVAAALLGFFWMRRTMGHLSKEHIPIEK